MNMSAMNTVDCLPLWGSRFLIASGLATLALSTLLEGCQGLRLSRLSLPFLLGTLFTDKRRRAFVLGFVLYMLGGLLTAALYALAFAVIGQSGWIMGISIGILNALFLLTVALPVLPMLHPRMASEHSGPNGAHGIEPPGFLALNYGAATPVVTILAHAVYGAILGALLLPG